MSLLGPYLDRDTEQVLREYWPHDGLPAPLPIPPRPDGTVATSAGGVAQARLLGIHLNTTWSVNASVSLGGGPSQTAGQVPCGDPRGCPDLVVDAGWLLAGIVQRQAFASSDCNVQEGSTVAGNRTLLRFSTTVPNIGDGDLKVGSPAGHPEWFEWGTCHGHWHFRKYADYRLWRVTPYLQWRHLREQQPNATAQEILASHPELQEGFVAGHKQGFCVIDVLPYLPIEPAKYWNCALSQGVSRGWADQYGFQLDGQFIDVTGLPTGPYVLEVEANAQRLYRELDYRNNSGSAIVIVPNV